MESNVLSVSLESPSDHVSPPDLESPAGHKRKHILLSDNPLDRILEWVNDESPSDHVSPVDHENFDIIDLTLGSDLEDQGNAKSNLTETNR